MAWREAGGLEGLENARNAASRFFRWAQSGYQTNLIHAQSMTYAAFALRPLPDGEGAKAPCAFAVPPAALAGACSFLMLAQHRPPAQSMLVCFAPAATARAFACRRVGGFGVT